MFRGILISILLGLSLTVFSQNQSFTSEESKSIEKQRTGANVWIEKDLVKNEIEFRSAVITKMPVLSTDYGIALKFRCYVTKVENSICLKSIEFKQKVSKTGMIVKYDKVVLIVGDNKDFKNGETIKYEFNVQSDQEGVAYINDIRIYDAFKFAIDNYKSVEIHFYNSVKDIDVSHKISTSKAKAKFGGLIDTYSNLKSSYGECNSGDAQYGNNELGKSNIKGEFILTKDEFYERTFYKHTSVESMKQITYESSPSVCFYAYFSVPFNSSKSEGLRLSVMYHGEDWIFFDRMIILVDGEPIEIKCDPETETLLGNGILEFTDISILDHPKLYSALSNISENSTIKIRLVGKYKHDYTLVDGVKNALVNTLKKYLELASDD